MSTPAIFGVPPAVNEPVRTYAPGSPERADLHRRLAEMAGERIAIPLVIGGERVETGTTFEAVMPHDRAHVLADVAKGDASHIERAIAAALSASISTIATLPLAWRSTTPKRIGISARSIAAPVAVTIVR